MNEAVKRQPVVGFARSATHDAMLALLRLCLRREGPWPQLSQVEWRQVDRLAAQAHIIPLLYNRLPFGIVPSGLAADWKLRCLHNAARNLRLFHELGQLQQRFTEAGIEVVALKGAALLPLLYDDIAARPMRDIDLLIRQEAIDAAVVVAHAAGFSSPSAELRDGHTRQFESELDLYKVADNVALQLELHWSLIDSPYFQSQIDAAWLWSATATVRYDATTLTVLNHEAQLLHMVSHLALHHHGEGYLWLFELGYYLQRFGGDVRWPQLIDRAERSELILPLREMLKLAVDTLWVELPPIAVQRLAAARSTRRARWLYQRAQSPAPAGQRLLVDLVSLPSWPTRLRFLWRNLFPSSGYMRQRYAFDRGWKLPYYYLYRLWRGLADLL